MSHEYGKNEASHTICMVNTSRGAPMGRRNYCTVDLESFDGLLYLRRVAMVDGAYDAGGAYWGSGKPLYRAYYMGFDNVAKCDCEVDIFLRANGREDAKKQLAEKYGLVKARFYK